QSLPLRSLSYLPPNAHHGKGPKGPMVLGLPALPRATPCLTAYGECLRRNLLTGSEPLALDRLTRIGPVDRTIAGPCSRQGHAMPIYGGYRERRQHTQADSSQFAGLPRDSRLRLVGGW